MRIEEHCAKTREIFGQDFEDIHKYLDRDFDWVTFERLSCLTDGDWYPQMESSDLFRHRAAEHHEEGIDIVVEQFRELYPANLVRAVTEMHIRDDYRGYLPSKLDFQNKEFIKKYHR